MKKTFVTCLLTVASFGASAWPDKPVTLVVPFPPGGSTDTIARLLVPKLQEKLGGSFIVENKAGATGTIGATAVARSAPDGHTLFVTSLGPLVIVPHLLKTGMQYDPLKDFDPLTVAVQAPNLLVVPAASPPKSMGDLISQLKKTPNKISFASSGSGSSDHLTAELFWQQTGTSGVHVPYKGGAPAINDLLGGQVDASFQNINAVVQHVKAGKLRAFAITSQTRSKLLPDVPTMGEVGVANVVVYSWQAVLAPKGLPADIKAKVHGAIVAGLNDPSFSSKLTDQGFEVVGNTPEEFSRFQAAEFARWKRVIEVGKITAN